MTGTVFDQLDDIALEQLSHLEDWQAIEAMKLTVEQRNSEIKFWSRFQDEVKSFEKYYNDKWKNT